MSDDHILVDDADGIRTITLNRPEVKNALTEAMRRRFCSLLSAAERDPAVRAVIVTATDPVFTAGVDFNEVASHAAIAAAPQTPTTRSFRSIQAARCGPCRSR